jgi:hypothetical protein
VTDALYLSTDDPAQFTGTALTAGPWSPELQHGGPPSALIARDVERLAGAWPFTVVRLAVEILGPVPVGPVTVSSAVVRTGRSVELVESELSAGGRPAMRARSWRIRKAGLDLPAVALAPVAAPPMPASDTTLPDSPGGFLGTLQMRFVEGRWTESGPATVWARLRVPLVDGEPASGLQRLMVLADCGNGLSSVLPITDWLFINPDLVVHLNRYPRGEWMCSEATTTVDPDGFGLASSRLYDETGAVGRGAQSLYIAPR